MRKEKQVAVYIPAYNVEKYIEQCLVAVKNQTHPIDEIVVINDGSTDRSAEIASKMGVHLIDQGSNRGLSTARNTAFQHLKSPFIASLDADCIPSIHYLQTINKYFSVGIQMLVNIPKIIHGQKLLNKYLLFERVVTWSIAASGVGHGKPFLAFGGSMGYTRQLLEEVKNFDKISNSLSGDDDLLIYQMGTYNPSMAVCFDPEGWVKTPSPESLSVFFKQRRRHHSAGRYYSLRIKTGYFVFHLSNISLWILPFFYWPAIYVFMVKLIVDISFLKYAGRIFKEKISIMNFFLFEIGYVFHFAFVAPFGFIGRVKWK